MTQSKPGAGMDDGLQYRFVAYLHQALTRRAYKYFKNLGSQQEWDGLITEWAEDRSFDLENEIFLHSPLLMGTCDDRLSNALQNLNKKEQQILFSFAVEGKGAERISKELHISCAAARARYYRTIQKIRDQLEGSRYGSSQDTA